MAGRIVILTGSHICHNPRVNKEATALAEAGYDVEIMGGWFDPVLKARDQKLMAGLKFHFRPLEDLTEQPVLRFWLRLRGRLARMIHEKFDYESHWQLGYFVSALRKAFYRSKADLFIAHSEPALWAVGKRRRPTTDHRPPDFRIGLDMEDWFSEDLSPETRRHRPVKLLRNLERMLLRNAVHATCTSRAMSEALAKEYGCRPPTVIYNAFPWSDRASIDGQFNDRQDCSLPSIHWYSQTLGTDRGLDELFAALALVKREAEIHLRGKPVAGFGDWLAARVPQNWRKRIFIHGLVSNDELLSRIAEHDIGFAGEKKNINRNHDLTVSNKILHYLLGGVAVVASDTAGQREVAEQAMEAVRIYPSGNPSVLAKELNALLSSPETLLATKAAALATAERLLSWEKTVPNLVASVKRSLGGIPSRSLRS